jgi:hypothetical protein
MTKSLASLKILHRRKISTFAVGWVEFLLHVAKMNYFLDRETNCLKQTLMTLSKFFQSKVTRSGTGFYVVKIDLVD